MLPEAKQSNQVSNHTKLNPHNLQWVQAKGYADILMALLPLILALTSITALRKRALSLWWVRRKKGAKNKCWFNPHILVEMGSFEVLGFIFGATRSDWEVFWWTLLIFPSNAILLFKCGIGEVKSQGVASGPVVLVRGSGGRANDDHWSYPLFSPPPFLSDSDQYDFWSSNEQRSSGPAIGF